MTDGELIAEALKALRPGRDWANAVALAELDRLITGTGVIRVSSDGFEHAPVQDVFYDEAPTWPPSNKELPR